MGTGGGQPWVSLAKGMPFVMSKEKCQLALMSLRHVGELLPGRLGTRPWRALDAGHRGEGEEVFSWQFWEHSGV